MGSKLLPQVPISMPRTTSPCSSKKLGFCTLFPTTLSSFNSNRITLSRVSSTRFNSTISPIAIRWTKRSFVVKAESNSEGVGTEPEPEAAAEAEVEVEVEAVEAVEAEPKPPTPRKPRIKMGDIMGILNKRAIEASEKERPIPEIRTGDIMGILNKRAIEASEKERPIPEIRTGDVVEIKLEVPENRRRASIYKGIVISRQNAGIHTTIRIRRIIAGIGVEIVFPLYSPNIKVIKVVAHRKVRRARLYYLRDKLPRLSTFK